MENILVKEQLNTNLDTNFLKVIAIIAMTLDHIGKAFFPEMQMFQIIGRIAFPIFAYCIVVGVTYTSNFKKYLVRLGGFALISQLPWVLAFNPTAEGMSENWLILNIFFTLFFSAIFVYGMKEKNWLYLGIGILAFTCLRLDYGFDTVLLLMSLYLLRNNKVLSCIITTLVLVVPLFGGGDLNAFGIQIGLQGLAILAVPFIFIKTNMNLKVNKYFFYGFYPVHLLVIFLLRFILKV